jgi:Tfp pilus assembly protein PilW
MRESNMAKRQRRCVDPNGRTNRGLIVNADRNVGWLRLVAAALLLTLAFSSTAFGDTGALRIRVSDSAGNPVTGAGVHASTPESLTEKFAVTDVNGEARLLGLDPSEKYVVVVSGDGIQSLRNENVQVISERTISINYVVQTGTDFIEELIVIGRSGLGQLVDTSSALQSTDITLDMTDSLPTGRTYQSYLQMAPSTKPTFDGNPSSKSGINYRDREDSNGNTSGTSSDNVYYIDGINITDNADGTFGANFNSEIIQEQQIITGGVPAEYDGGQGLISRVITKSGSNEFHGSINYYTQSDNLVADNENLEDATFSTFDAAFTLGGPIVKDKLWFFASLQKKQRKEDIIDPVTDTFLRTVTTSEDLGFGKLTWQATDKDKFVAEFFNDPSDRDGSNDTFTLENRDSARVQGGDNHKFEFSHAWKNAILTANIVSHEGEASDTSADKTTRNNVAYQGVDVTNAETELGGRGIDNISFRNKDSVNLTFEYFRNTSAGSHEIKMGYSQVDNEKFEDFVFPGGEDAQYSSIGRINSGATLSEYTTGEWSGNTNISEDVYPDIIDAMATSGDSAYFLGLLDADLSGDIDEIEMGSLVFDTTEGNPHGQVNVYRRVQTVREPTIVKTNGDAWFLQDTWQINNHWTIDAGIRAEKWDHIASDGSKLFTFDYEIAPRLSLIYDIKGDGRSKAWGYYGRYYDPIRTNMAQFVGTLIGSVLEGQLFIGDQWVSYRTRGGPRGADAVFSPTTKIPYTDEFMLGYEHSLTSDMSVAVTYTDRETSDVMEDYDLDLYLDPDRAGGYALPLSYFGFDTPPTAAPYFIATLEGAKRTYKGVEVTWRKRRSADSRWFALTSWSYNDTKGNSNSDSDADFQGDAVWLDPRAPNQWGPQPGNIKHLVKLAGSYQWDNGIEIGATYFWNSGLLYSEAWRIGGWHLPSRVDTAYEDNGVTTRWLAPNSVGSHSSSSYGSLNLRAKYVLDFGSSYSAEFFVDIFNALDNQAATREQDLLRGDGVYDFGEDNAWVLPRRFYLGVRLSF